MMKILVLCLLLTSCTTMTVMDIQPDIQIVPVVHGLRITDNTPIEIKKQWTEQEPQEQIGLYVGLKLILY